MPSSLSVKSSTNDGAGGGDQSKINALFDQFVTGNTFHAIMSSFQQLCVELDINRNDHRNFYRRIKSKLTSWKAQSLWKYLDKRASHKEYKKQTACSNTRLFVIGCGPCGLRMAIEGALLGARVVVVEKRDRFSRNNVLHLWPFLITDLKTLGAKKFFGKFCAGSIDHISIRTLQCILCKVALLYGCQIYPSTGFEGLVEPPANQEEKIGWRVKVDPADSPVNSMEFDVLIGADGKRNTLEGFNRKEFRGKLAIAITANFINHHTQAENKVEEISGVAFIFNQKFFRDLADKTGIDLENIVYYKDEVHYFVMTAKKSSLLDKGVLLQDNADTAKLLSRENIDQEQLLSYAREAAEESTCHQLPNLEFALNHYGQPDVAVFDFTSLFQSENACRVVERNGHRLLIGIVGDSLLEPFWPTGSGCARGFLGCFDAAWMMKNWTSGKMTPLEVIAERESIFTLLSQTSPENLSKDHHQYTIHPNTRYRTVNKDAVKPIQVRHLYTGDAVLKDQIVKAPSKKLKPEYTGAVDSDHLLKWCQKQLDKYKNIVKVTDLTSSWKNGLAVCALIHLYRPDLINLNSLHENNVAQNNQLAFNTAERELGISPIMTGQEMADCDVPDKLFVVSYVSQFYELFKNERPNRSFKSPKTSASKPSSLKSPRRQESAGKRSQLTIKPSAPPLTAPTGAQKASLLNRLTNTLAKTKRDRKERESIMRIEKTKMVERHRQMLIEKQQQAEAVMGSKFVPEREIKFGNLTKKRIAQMDSVDAMDNKYSKYEEIDAKIKETTRVMEKGNLGNMDTGVRGSNLVSAMATALTTKMEETQKVPSPPPKKKNTAEQLAFHHPKASEFCYFCKKRVYLMERQSAEGYFFHRGCLKCEYCGATLRPGSHAFQRTVEGEGKFYCTQHLGMQKRIRRKRSFTDMTDTENIPSISTEGPDTSSLFDIPDIPPISKPKTPRAMDQLSIAQMKQRTQTPERIEFELSFDENMMEPDEDVLTEHNLRSSMSTENLSDNEDDWTTESEWTTSEESETDTDDSDWASESGSQESEGDEYDDVLVLNSDEDEEAKAESLQKKAKLMKQLSRLHSSEDVESTDESESEYETGSDEEEEEEEEESDDGELDEPADDEDDEVVEPKPQRTNEGTEEVKHKPALEEKSEPKPRPEETRPRSEVISPSTQQIQRNRMNFFMQAPEPVRIDPRAFFGFDRHPSKLTKEKTPEKVVNIEIDKKQEVKSSDTEVKEQDDDDETGSRVEKMTEVGEEADGTDEPYFETEDGIIFEKESDFHETEKEIVKDPQIAIVESDLIDSNKNSKSSSEELAIDDFFVTSRRSRQKSANQANRNSGSSFTISTPTESVKSFASSVDSNNGQDKESESCTSNDETPNNNTNARFSEGLSEKFMDYMADRDIHLVSDGSHADKSKCISMDSDAVESSRTTSLELDEDMRLDALSHSHADVGRNNESMDDTLDRMVDVNAMILGSDIDTELSTVTRSSVSSQDDSVYETPKGTNDNKENCGDIIRPDSLALDRKTSTDLEVAVDSPTENENVGQNLKRKISVDVSALELSQESQALTEMKKTVSVDPELLLMDNVFKTPSPVDENQPELAAVSSTESPVVSSQEQFFTPMTSVKTRKDKPIVDTPMVRDTKPAKKRLLPTLPFEAMSSDRIRGQVLEKVGLGNTKNVGLAIESNNVSGPEVCVDQDSNKTEKMKTSNKHQPMDVDPASIKEVETMDTEVSPDTVGIAVRDAELMSAAVTDTPELAAEKPQKMETNINTPDGDVDTPMKALGILRKDTPEMAVKRGRLPMEETIDVNRSLDTPTKEFNASTAARRKDFFNKVTVPVRIDPNSVITGQKSEKAEEKADVNLKEGETIEEFPFADESSPDKTPLGGNAEVKMIQESFEDISGVSHDEAMTGNEEKVCDVSQSPALPVADDPPSAEKKDKKGKFKKNKDKKEKSKSKSPDPGEGTSCDIDKKEKRKSWFAMLLSSKSKDKKMSDSVEKDDAADSKSPSTSVETDAKKISSSKPENETPTITKDKKSKTPKSKEKKKDKKKGKDKATANEESIAEKVKELRLHERPLSMTSEEDRQRVTAHVKSMTRRAPKASEDDFTETDSDLNEVDKEEDRKAFLQRKLTRRLARRMKSDEGTREQIARQLSQRLQTIIFQFKRLLISGKELDAAMTERLSRKVQRAARKQQRQQELKRLRMAQEIQRQLEEVEVKHKTMEDRGVSLEKVLRGEGDTELSKKPEDELMQEWFNLVHEKNVLVRYESELMVRAKELELEDRHSRLEQALREKMEMEESKKTVEDTEKEKKILEELLDVVEQRDALVKLLEEDRLREQEEDKHLGDIMDRRGFQLSPITYCKSLSKWIALAITLLWLVSLFGTFLIHFTYKRDQSSVWDFTDQHDQSIGEMLGDLVRVAKKRLWKY